MADGLVSRDDGGSSVPRDDDGGEVWLGGRALGGAADPGDRSSFRLAAFGAVLVLVLFAGYGLGRLNDGTAASGPPGGSAQTGSAQPGSGPAGSGSAGSGPAGSGQSGSGQPGSGQTGASAPVLSADGHLHGAGGAGGAGGVAGSNGAAGSAASAASAAEAVGGLALTSSGLTLRPLTTAFEGGVRQPLRFQIIGGGGAPVTTFAVVHDKPLHLVVIRRDLSGFQHLHPQMGVDGTWSIDLTLLKPGSYRMIADFTAVVGGQQIATTLGADLTVPGDYEPTPLPAPTRSAVATTDAPGPGGELTVGYEGDPALGSVQPLLMSVPGAVLEPYLGAYGHLVVLREGDVGYVHVHPEPQLIDGKVKFWLAVPGPGRYRMFFDFQESGRLHTAAWTTEVG